jgi:hypothetical protein
MAQTFAAQVDAWARESRERMDAVYKTAISYTFEEVQDRTPVDTGFLRASFKATTGAPQTLNERNPGGVGYTPEPFDFVIAGVEYGDTVYGTFSANYAGHVEYGANGRPGRGMVRLAAQNWQVNVNRAVSSVRGS